MKTITKLMFVFAFSILGFLPSQGLMAQEPVIKTFPTGARPTPAHRIASAVASGKVMTHKVMAAPEQVVMIPSRLSYWGNDRYGICVSAESAFAIGAYSKFVSAETYVTEETIISWARAHGVLNGADLLSVIEDMQKDGVKDEKGRLWKEGVASIVNFHSEPDLKSAVATGPISIAIASSSLPANAGGKSGWFIVTPRNSRSTDHCVSICGYGKAKWLCEQLGVPLPSGLDPNKMMYLLFTWNSIGLVSFEWLQGTCEEAWLRTPTVVGLPSPSPDPGPTPNPNPTPGPVPTIGTILTIDKTLQPGSYEVMPVGIGKKLKEVMDRLKEIERLLEAGAGTPLKIEPTDVRVRELPSISIEQAPTVETDPPPLLIPPVEPLDKREKYDPTAGERDPKTGKLKQKQ